MAGRANLVFSFLLFLVLHYVDSSELTNMIDEDVLTTKAFVFWPNATIPFYIDNEHFDNEQSVTIMTALSLFAFKTCLKFAPVMARPEDTDHVLLLENPTGVRKCTINTEPHSIEEPHRVTLGYDCLKSPEIDMMIMKALGFPFEHNRAVRDLYIEVQPENVEPGFLDLFTRDLRLPLELRAIPYDPNSVMHFGQRDFSKNGHRTIIFKNSNLRQERFGLSPLDLRKIDVVYGPECRVRDRQEKVELCQNYPGVARRKREAQSLRVNPDITPPPENVTGVDTRAALNFSDSVAKTLGIEKELAELVDKVNHVAGIALQQAKSPNCDNKTKTALRTLVQTSEDDPKPKVIDIIGDVAAYAQNVVYKATRNLTEFCLEEADIHDFLRSSCPFFNKDMCPKSYRSTKSGPVKYSTQHRPLIRQSTKPQALEKKHIYENWYRSGNNTEEPTATDVSPSDASPSDASPSDASPSGSDPKQDLRSGNTRLPTGNKSIYVPNYRASNDTDVKERKKRETSKDTAKVSADKLKDPKAAVVSKVKKPEKKIKSAKRRFESQRFRSQKGVYNREQREREWENSDVTGEKMSHNDDGQTNDYVGRKGRIMDKRSKRSSVEKRTRADDDDPKNENGDPKNENDDHKNEETEPIFDDKKPKEEKVFDNDDKQPDKEALRTGKKRHSYNDKNYDYKEPKYGEKKSKYEDSYENKRYEGKTRYGDDDRKTRLQKQESRYEDEDRYGNKDPKFNNKEPSYDEKRPRYKDKGGDYSDERPIGKNRFKIHKPPQSKASGETGGGGRGSRISDEKEEDYQSKHGRDVKTKSRGSAENYYHDIHDDGVDNDGKMHVKRPRVSDDEEQKGTDMMQYRDTDSPVPKRLGHNKKGKTRHPKSHAQASDSEEDHPQPTGGLPRVLKLDKKNEEFYEERKWPDGVVRYVIKDPGNVDLADVRARLDEVNQILKRRTCARLEELTEEEADNYEDFLVLDNSPDYVTGRVGGRQVFGVVELLRGGQHRQHAAMMVMAMLGFYFEISRHDRDKYIRVHMRHIRPDKLHHFEKVREDATFPLPYDYKSATHPAWQFWRQIGRTGISTVATFKQQDPDGSVMKSLGQNKQLLSELDLVKINSVYGIECFMPKDRQRDDRGGERQGEGEEEREEKKTSDVSLREDDED